MALGDGTHMLPVKADIRKAINKEGGRHRERPPPGADRQLTSGGPLQRSAAQNAWKQDILTERGRC